MYRLSGLILACLLAPTMAAAAPTMTLPMAEKLALRSNLELRASDQALQARMASRIGARGLYDPLFNGTLSANRSKSNLGAGGFFSENERSTDASLALSQQFSTGALLSATIGQDRLGAGGSLSSNFQSDFGISLSQPLLRDFGPLATEQDIRRAEKNEAFAVQDREVVAAVVLRDVRTSWYEVLRLQQNLQLRAASIKLARQLEEENKARVDAGVLPAVELLSAQVGLQLRLQQERDAFRELEDERDRLTLLIQNPLPTALEAVLPQPVPMALNVDDGMALARQKRPEVRRSIVAIEQAELEVAIAKNQQRPDLSLIGNYTRNVFEDGFDNSLDALSDEDASSWSVGLNFSYPFGNRQRRGETRAAESTLQQTQLLHQQTLEEVRREIERAARFLTTRLSQLKAVQLESRLAQERVTILVERQKIGLATVTDVLDGEEDLTDARVREFQALADVQIAQAAYLFATGGLLADARLALDSMTETEVGPMPANDGE